MTEETQGATPRRTLRQWLRNLIADIRGRSLLVRIAIAAAAITVFVLIPAFIATRPAFTQRYPNMETEYESWATSVHARVSCQSCHISPSNVSQAAYSLRMAAEFYLQLLPISREPELLDTPSSEACSSCHIDLRAVSPSGDLNIPHQAHVDVLEMQCVECHDYLVHETNPQGNNAPTMAGCMECHDGVKAKRDCDACHNEKGAPNSHKAANWTIVHPDKQEQEDCVGCHGWSEQWCAQCHGNRPRSHTEDWRKKHGAVVAQRRNCEACHEATFCEKCHGEVPQLNFDSALQLAQ